MNHCEGMKKSDLTAINRLLEFNEIQISGNYELFVFLVRHTVEALINEFKILNEFNMRSPQVGTVFFELTRSRDTDLTVMEVS